MPGKIQLFFKTERLIIYFQSFMFSFIHHFYAFYLDFVAILHPTTSQSIYRLPER